MYKIVVFNFLIFSLSCNAQENRNPPIITTTPPQRPIVIKNYTSARMTPDSDTALVSQYIRSIFQDSKGNLWFGTIEDGVVKYDKKSSLIFRIKMALSAIQYSQLMKIITVIFGLVLTKASINSMAKPLGILIKKTA